MLVGRFGPLKSHFDSLVTSEEVTKVGTDQGKWGSMLAQWLVDELDGEGDIIAFNGPAGVAVSEDRWAGAKSVFDENPGINIVTTLNSEYNIAPAEQAFAAAYAANPEIDGVFAQGGALASAALQTSCWARIRCVMNCRAPRDQAARCT